MNILILGSGGREHAFAWKIAQSPLVSKLFVGPGNAGTPAVAQNIPLNPEDFEEVKRSVIQENIGLVLVGPEAPLVKGIADFFKQDAELAAVKIIGPSKQGAALEGSKDFSKAFMKRHNIPTAAYATFSKDTLDKGLEYLETQKAPFVLKADGLAAGKGVLICQSLAEAKQSLKEMLADAKFGEASSRVVIEEYLDGIEMSSFILTDGKSYKIMPSAKDYKRIGEGDTGLNTGGMGAVSPVPFADAAFMKKVEDRVIIPTVKGLGIESIEYKGFVFIGLMNVAGDPFVIEYNVRMGDPETEVVIPRIQSDFLAALIALADDRLHEAEFLLDPRTAAAVMLVSGGYPEEFEKGKEVSGFENTGEALVFHAGTKLQDGKTLTSGGRVIAVTGIGDYMGDALAIAKQAANAISYEGKYFRRDIGEDLRGY